VADDFMATDLDGSTSKITIEGGVYLAQPTSTICAPPA
jgi:hypothetical protein